MCLSSWAVILIGRVGWLMTLFIWQEEPTAKKKPTHISTCKWLNSLKDCYSEISMQSILFAKYFLQIYPANSQLAPCFALYSKILSKLHRIETYIKRMYAKQGPAFGHGFRQAHQAKMWNQKLSKNTSLTHIPPLAKSNFLHNTQDRRIKHCRQYVSSKQNPPNITWHTWIETTIKKKVARLFIGEPIS